MPANPLIPRRTDRLSLLTLLFPGLLALLSTLFKPDTRWLALAAIPVILTCAIGLARKYPVGTLSGVVAIFITANVRLGVAHIGVDSAGGIRGWLSIGDLLIAALAISAAIDRTKARARGLRTPASVLLLLPYIILSMALPIVGVVGRGLPISYSLPAVHCAQWLVLAYLGYTVAARYGTALLTAINRTLMIGAILDAIYAAIQIGYYQLKLFPRTLVAWDNLYVKQNFAGRFSDSWFGWRATGLEVNPNLYGLTACLIMISILASTTTYKSGPRLLRYAGAIACASGIFVSGSRSAAFAVLAGAALALLMRPTAILRRLPASVKLISICAVVGTAVMVLMPELYTSRFVDTLTASGGWAADASLLARIEGWKALLASSAGYPFGTWVPPSYIFPYAVDSMYIQTAVQGTAFYTATFIVFILGGISLGWRCSTYFRTGPVAGLGAMLGGWCLAIAIASISMGALDSGDICAPFATVCGAAIYFSRRKKPVLFPALGQPVHIAANPVYISRVGGIPAELSQQEPASQNHIWHE